MTNTTTTQKATLEYRRPGAAEAGSLSIAATVQQRELAYRAASWTMFGAGAAVTILGLALLATFFAGLEKRLAPQWAIDWWTNFGVLSIALTPLLFWWERRTNGQWFEEEVRAQGTTPAELWRCSSRGEWELRTTAASWAAFCELLLWGPRMIACAWSRRRQRTPLAIMNEAAALIHYLRHFDGGIEVNELPSAQPAPVLRYLVSRDWVGVSKSGDRVWLLSDARKAMGLD